MKENKNKIILDLCGGTGGWSKPYKKAGYDVRVITFPAYNVLHYIDLMPDNVYGILAAPPCTMFSLARTTAKTPRDLESAMKIVRACLEIIWKARLSNKLQFWAMENPKGLLRQFIGKPVFTFDPSEFGADYNKATDIWGYFNSPKKKFGYKRFDTTDTNSRKLPEIPADYVIDANMSITAIKRSITNPKFAEAFFKANK
ncbi:MAG TPA: hypothetical protein PLE33_05885 [Candidatus Cloacimonas sp.]|nr:hypothetical protein [Candidatus Cloacimonas sp.]HPS60775.1 hypothetical protein [Candidatus Cloacimonas sp.]